MFVGMSLNISQEALKEIKTPEFIEAMQNVAGVNLSPNPPACEGVAPRMTGLEVFATIVASAACLELARAIRDFVRRNKLNVVLERSDGEVLVVEASGSDHEWIERVEEFLKKTVGK